MRIAPALEEFRSSETRTVALGVDIRSSLRLCLALLLFVVAVGPVCLLMSPSMAMAGEMPSEGCGAPTAPASSTIDCPHEIADDEIAVARNAVDMCDVPPAVAVGPVAVPEAESFQPEAAVSVRPVAHLTPLRL